MYLRMFMLHCDGDGCMEEAGPEHFSSILLEEARAEGWLIRQGKDALVLCPECR